MNTRQPTVGPSPQPSPPSTAETETESFTIDRVFPWGRSFDEYVGMFALTERDLASRIVSVADGPASFNAELTRRGGHVRSYDPLYRFGANEIRSRVHATRDVLVNGARANAHRFVWDRIRSPEELELRRLGAMETFLDDYERGRREGRYVDASLPSLGLGDDGADIAVCSHFLFLYSDEFPASFHVDAVSEMARVAAEVRVFPLLDMTGGPSAHVQPVVDAMRARGLDVERVRVAYEFQRGGNQMLRVTR